MASELAANTLHAQMVAEAGGGGVGSRPLRRTWRASRPCPPARPLGPRRANAEGGRGLQIVRRSEELDLEQRPFGTR
jgi:hypothetical protein